MADGTQIEWADATWNPVTGCSKITAGCDSCYAERFSERFRGVPDHPFEKGFDLTLRPARLIQPLSWKAPRRVFVNAERQESRSYRIERIQGATIVNRSFSPKYQIELTPSGPLIAPAMARVAENPWRQAAALRRSTGSAWGKTTYLYRCQICRKRFERTSMDATLRAHKNPAGYPCGGRHGIYVGTK